MLIVRIALLLLLGVVGLPSVSIVHAQEASGAFYPSGTTWEEERHCYHPSLDRHESQYTRHTVEGDTMVNGQPYKLVRVEMRIPDEQEYDEAGVPVLSWDRVSPWHWENFCTYAIREDQGRVYYYGDGFIGGIDGPSPKEHLRYDFNWKLGAETPWRFNSRGEMTSITVDSLGFFLLADGEFCPSAYSKSSETFVQVSGIGNLGDGGGLMLHSLEFPWDGSTMRYARVLNFTRNGVKLYEWDREAYVSKQMELLGVGRVIQAPSLDRGKCYDLQGRPAFKKHPKGIYIQDGKKRLGFDGFPYRRIE